MNIHLGLALALILAGVVLVGVSLSDGGPRSPHMPGSQTPPSRVEAVAAVGGAGQG